MTPDEYLNSVLQNYHIPSYTSSQYQQIANNLYPEIKNWANGYLIDVCWSGSYAKGTAIKSATDIDLFISVQHNIPSTLENMYNTLFNRFNNLTYNSRKQNVSIGITVNGISVDLIPARKLSGNTNDHNLWKNKQQTSIKTNIIEHINLIKNSNRIDEIKIMKIWRKLHNVDISSFYLELIVLEALYGKRVGDLANNIVSVLDYLGTEVFRKKQFVDPSNSANIVSDELSDNEKLSISLKALSSRNQDNWNKIVW